MSALYKRVVLVVFGLFWAIPVSGQEVLVHVSGIAGTSPMAGALRDLEIAFENAQTNQETLDAMRAQEWDLVVIQRTVRFPPDFESDILAELEAHVDRGGRLHFQMADLERVPAAWHDLLGLVGASDLQLPLSHIESTFPAHPSGGGFLLLSDDRFPPDYGDALLPASATIVTQRYLDDQRASTVLSHGTRVLVNGQQWDNWNSTDSRSLARVQLRWLTRCEPDFDLDGELSIGDFLEFQNYFAAGDLTADIDADGELTVFDFLVFFNLFDAGCE